MSSRRVAEGELLLLKAMASMVYGSLPNSDNVYSCCVMEYELLALMGKSVAV